MQEDIFNYESVFGTPSYEKKVEEVKWRRQRLKVPAEGELSTEFVCRIIPPVKSCRTTREWYVKHEEFYGYDVRDKVNKGKTRARPFTIEGFYDTHKNPAMQKIYNVRREMTQFIQQLSSTGASQEEIELKAQPFKKWLKQHNKDTKYNINVYTAQGQVLVLQLTPKAFTQLDALVNKLNKDGTDPLDPRNGVWFVFTRTGNPNVLSTITDTVDVLKEKVQLENGIKAEITKTAPISPEMAKKIDMCAPDLHTEIIRPLTQDLVAELVAGPEDPDFVEKIWAKSAEKNGVVAESSNPGEEFFKNNFSE